MIHSEKRQFSKTELQLFSKKKSATAKVSIEILTDPKLTDSNRNRKFLCLSFHTVILAFVGFSVPLGSHKYLKTLYICTNLKKKRKKETQSQNQQQKPAKQIKKTLPSTDRANIEYYLFQNGSF